MHLGARVRRLASRVAVAAAAGCTVALACSAPSALADSVKRVRFRKSDTETLEAAGGEGGIEILVHNLSHADMAVLLTARESADGSQPMTSKARPLFNQYHFVSAAILRHIDHLTQLGITLRPVQARCVPSWTTEPIGISLVADGGRDEPIGATLDGPKIAHGNPAKRAARAASSLGAGLDAIDCSGGMEGAPVETPWERFHLKGTARHDRRPNSFRRLDSGSSSATHASDAPPGACQCGVDHPPVAVLRPGLSEAAPRDDEAPPQPLQEPSITAVILPIVAALLLRWTRTLDQQRAAEAAATGSAVRRPKKVLLLVSGSGQPRDTNADPDANSTHCTSYLVERFVQLCYADIRVVHVSSTGGMFRYDDNLGFVQREVLPVIERERAAVVAAHGEEWPRYLNITLSLADGAPARIAALNASLRPYRPNYLHVWRLKTWWDSDQLVETDVDFHAFNKLEMRPAVPTQLLAEEDRLVVEEMRSYRRQFEAVRDGAPQEQAATYAAPNELSSFWLRKSHKAVLAVLLCRKPTPGAPNHFYRGMNLEVSMPTGTLCAERNAIGNALASDQTLRREDIRSVAVLSVSLAERPPDELVDGRDVALNPLDPCGACMEWLRKIAEVNPDFKVITFSDTTCDSAIITPIDYLTV